jgi:hypothetical protein
LPPPPPPSPPPQRRDKNIPVQPPFIKTAQKKKRKEKKNSMRIARTRTAARERTGIFGAVSAVINNTRRRGAEKPKVDRRGEEICPKGRENSQFRDG